MLFIPQVVAVALVINRLRHGANRNHVTSPAPALVTTSVSVVIPARNEASRLPACLDGLTSEKLHELIVVDDCSTDGTAEVARGRGALVIDGSEPPEGWVGKQWALEQGLGAATGEIVLFLDADTIPRPGIVDAIASRLEQNDLVSLAARFHCSSQLETALHTSLLATLVYRFGPPGNQLEPERVIVNGQCIAMRRQWLLDEGGFGLAASNMTDDIALGRKLAARGARVDFVDGSDYIEVDMHESAQEAWREWGRSLPMHDATSPTRRWADLATLWLTLGLPWLRLLTGRVKRLDVALIAMRFLLGVALGRSYAAPAAGRLLSPFTDVAGLVCITLGSLRPRRLWRGRSYPAHAQTESANQ